MNHYPKDPYWTVARFDSVDKQGKPVMKGTKIFYYPNSKAVYQGQAAEDASNDFQACLFDERNF